MIVEDFNLIYKANDKNNNNLNKSLMNSFREAINKCELTEIPL